MRRAVFAGLSLVAALPFLVAAAFAYAMAGLSEELGKGWKRP